MIQEKLNDTSGDSGSITANTTSTVTANANSKSSEINSKSEMDKGEVLKTMVKPMITLKRKRKHKRKNSLPINYEIVTNGNYIIKKY